MSSTILEHIRLNHEYAELYERAICDELDSKPQGVLFLQFIDFYYYPYVTICISLFNLAKSKDLAAKQNCQASGCDDLGQWGISC